MALYNGTEGADSLTGSAAVDTINGYGGNDTLIGAASSDVIDGGDGIDRVQFNGALAGVFVDLTNGVSKGVADYLNGGSADAAGVGVDAFRNIEWINGTGFGDYLTAAGFGVTAGVFNMSTTRNTSNTIWAGRGNDTITGNGDTEITFNDINVNSGVVVDLQAGTAIGSWTGNDVINGGIISIAGTRHNDRIKGTNTNRSGESFSGIGGNDTFEGGGGYDSVLYTAKINAVVIDLAAGTVITGEGAGQDTLLGIEAIVGSAHADIYDASGFGLVASNANKVDDGGLFNSFEGRGGNDVITGNGATRIAFNHAAAAVRASLVDGVAKDLVDARNETSLDAAGIGVDTFTGVNSLRGSAYGDVLIGGRSESDQLEQFEGRAGNDSIDGGSGYDRANYHLDGLGTTFIVDNGNVQFALDENGQQIFTTGLVISMAAGTVVGDPLVTGSDQLRGIEGIRGTWLNDSYDARGFSAESINGGSRGFFNDFEGFTGNDTITGNGHTRLSYMGTFAAVYVNLETGEALDKADKLNGTSLDVAKVGVDVLVGGINSLRGSSFDDTLIGGVAANDLLEVFDGRTGNDVLSGGSGFDRVRYDNDGSVSPGYTTVRL